MHRCRANVLALLFADAQFDLVLCNEVLEHLRKPEIALRELRRVTRAYVLLSVPHEPWFRLLNALRGKHLWAWGNDPEHIQNWTGRQFVDFVVRDFVVVKQASAFPWLLLLCRKKHLVSTR
jgi:ubiquinone/menaquinone biosynthesis C-methylase UbiE